MENKNFACRIFKEQIELILQLPENERAEVLYKSVLFGFNQIDCQFDNQNENQNESAYVSVSDSVSILSNKIFNLLKKNISWKEFSNNYGGSRKGAGAPKGNTNAKKNNQIDCQNDIQIDNQTDCKKIDFDTTFKAGGQLWTLPPNFRKLALTRYTESEIRAFEITHSCHESLEDVCLNDIKHLEPKKKQIEISDYGEYEPLREQITKWIEYKKARKESYKTEQSLMAFAKKLFTLSWGKPDIADQIIEQSMANNWAGIFELKQNQKKEKINFSFYTGEGSFLKPDGEW